jgi:hypothetical protein
MILRSFPMRMDLGFTSSTSNVVRPMPNCPHHSGMSQTSGPDALGAFLVPLLTGLRPRHPRDVLALALGYGVDERPVALGRVALE